MADPISVTGLLLQLSQNVASLISYAKAVRATRSETQKLSEELFALKGILDHLASQVDLKPPPYEPDAPSPFNSETLLRALHTTNEFLQSLLKDLEEPATKFARLKQKLEWPFTQEQFNTHLIRLERVKSWLILVLMTDSMALERDMQLGINSLANSVEKHLSILNQERLQKADRDLLHWLAPVTSAHTHLRASRNREIGTGTWFIDGRLKDWLRSNNDDEKILFLRAGAGKTTLFAHAVDELTSISSCKPDLCVAYFYCTFGDVASQDPTNILGSLVAQLSGVMPSILDGVRPLYKKSLKQETHRPPIELTALEDAIIQNSSGKTRVVLLIDAINESPHADRIKRSLLGLADLCTNLHILVTSTEDTMSSRHVSIMNLDAEIIQYDIAAFINHRIKQDETLRNVSAKLKDEIRTTLLHDADGSFRWVQLSLDNLGTQRTARSIYQSLHALPGTLRETYGNLLWRIPESDWKYVREALLWLSFAKRPLTLDELNEAVVQEETSTMLNDDMKLVSPQIVLQICQGLITQDRSGMVNLAHSSIKDFLTSEWIRSSKVRYFGLDSASADKTLMRRCLAYLSLENFRCGYTLHSFELDLRLKTYPFLSYAAYFWALHGAASKFNGSNRALVYRFFETQSLPRRGNFGVWVQTLIPDVDRATIETTSPLYYAASFGLVTVVKAILASDPDIDIDSPGGRNGSTPLFVACWRHQYQVAEILLDAGADPHIKDNSGYTVFSLAKAAGIRPLEALLARSADRRRYTKPAARLSK